MKKKKLQIGSSLYIALAFVFMYLPIVMMMIFSFNDSKSLTVWSGFSTRWYEALLTNNDVAEAVYYTLVVAVLATVISTFVGTITAIGLSKSRKVLKEIVLNLNDLPMLNPDIVTAIGLMLLFSSIGTEKGFMTMLLAHIAFCIPYVILNVMPKLRDLDPNVAEAAMDLGATPWQALWKVIVPQITPGILSGALIAFTMSIDDFVISYFVTGNGVKNISILVYSMSKRINPTINALSTIIVVIVTLVLVGVNVAPILKEKFGEHKIVKNVVSSKPVKYALAACIALLAFVVYDNRPNQVSATSSSADCTTLKVFNTGEYIAEDTRQRFEEEFGVQVVYDLFASNEEMYTRLLGGESYDVLVPSDYMVERLIQEDYLMNIDWSLIPNSEGLIESLTYREYDPGMSYAVPYFWGNVGIIYDSTVVDPEDVESLGWDIFHETKYAGDVYLYDSERDMFMVALKALGYSMNTADEDELQEAYEWLLQAMNTMDPVLITDEVIDNMIAGLKHIAVVYSGDATYMMSENENLVYYEPQQGTNSWIDSMVIPADSKCPILAHEWINYMLEEEIAYNNTVYVGYSSPIQSVFEEVSTDEEEGYGGISAYISREGYAKDEMFHYNEAQRKQLSELWTLVKAQ
ncbi:MAG: extracellular solute-binding protein [Erysipelotrichaceae bacterium]|nr:extracellular solute-binding protein [Erysipelotrichaceae bacterium]